MWCGGDHNDNIYEKMPNCLIEKENITPDDKEIRPSEKRKTI